MQQTYNRNVIKKFTAKPSPVGTPAKPGVVVPTLLFALYNENQKPGPVLIGLSLSHLVELVISTGLPFQPKKIQVTDLASSQASHFKDESKSNGSNWLSDATPSFLCIRIQHKNWIVYCGTCENCCFILTILLLLISPTALDLYSAVYKKRT
ncbi:hypothetical protein HAX54_033020 [Datura stramonium]|uniref:Uncharacterized protein n=1 Tax=Datura stramonium TaxID=4076 RepID=A0ABS8VEN2_DATST|nr:hypothetical protein [Datura stramonium]